MRSRIAATATVLIVLAAASGALARSMDAQASATKEGIDVSSFQGTIAWHSVAAAGISFAYIRAADGNGSGDQQFANNWRGATGAGVTPGAYLFFEPSQSPVAQANVLISQLRSVGFSHGDLMPAIDVETMGGEPQSVVVANLKTVVDTVSAAIGSLPAIYASPAWWNGNINSSAFTLDPLWVANWFVSTPQVPANNWGGTGWQVWQFSDAGSIPGISGRVDLDQGGTRSLPYYGWPDPVALAATNVAGTPQTVSDRPGDIDVLWRGTNDHVWTLGYRNGRWGTAATDISALAGSSAALTTDPSVVSSGAGRIDAFWEGADGSVWQSTYTAAWFGSGSWSAPASLGLGPLGSVPEAVSPGPGLIDLLWVGAGSALWVDRFSGTWSGATPLDSGTVNGTPVAVSAAVGSDTVFWRDASGDLWQDTGASWGWNGRQQLTTVALAANPSVSASGGDIDVFWNNAGQLLHVAFTAGVWSGVAALGTVAVEGNPAAVTLAPGAVIVDTREAVSGTLASALYTSTSGLIGPEGLGAVAGSDPSSVAFAGGGAIDVVWRSTTGGLWYAPACPGCAAPAVPVFNPAG
ncbi:MAG TPA: GH25 family lysozyme [Candidatus Saccharimonadales bacterium]|nr:GH25 family lysozyme [Candidatus Saccharimonadales bacterium]